MSIRLAISTAAAGVFALGLAVAIPGEALAQANVLKECGSQYQAAKAANQLNGQSWQEYLKACRARIAEPAAAPPAPTPAPRASRDARARKAVRRGVEGPEGRTPQNQSGDEMAPVLERV